MDGRTIPGKVRQTPGGVGRNLADCLAKLSQTPLLISAVGNDQFGQFLHKSVTHLDYRGVEIRNDYRTGCYFGIINIQGDVTIGIGDTKIHSTITQAQVATYVKDICNSSIVITDCNISNETMEFILKTCNNNGIPVWVEPTDVIKSVNPFHSEFWKTISCISPNVFELEQMAKAAGAKLDEKLDLTNVDRLLKQVTFLAQSLVKYIPLIMVTLNKYGILMVTSYDVEAPVKNIFGGPKGEISARYYPAFSVNNIKNSLGAGDSCAGGFIEGMLRGLTEPECITLGQLASLDSLQIESAIPKAFKHNRDSPYKADMKILSY